MMGSVSVQIKDPVVEDLMQMDAYSRASALAFEAEPNWPVSPEDHSPLQRVLLRQIRSLMDAMREATGEANKLRRQLELKEGQIAFAAEELGAVVDAWPLA